MNERSDPSLDDRLTEETETKRERSGMGEHLSRDHSGDDEGRKENDEGDLEAGVVRWVHAHRR